MFVNIKSGPQLGRTLLSHMLQLLHPLQVLDAWLSRALMIFKRMPLHGVGSQACLLNCMCIDA